jgi:hypothetical protein
MYNIEQWKLDLKSGNTVCWNSPCPPWLTITHYIEWIEHFPQNNTAALMFLHHDTIYTSYDWLSLPTTSQDLYADEAAYLESIKPIDIKPSKQYELDRQKEIDAVKASMNIDNGYLSKTFTSNNSTLAVYTETLENKSKEYSCWKNMKSRCYNNKHPDYARYGAKGITVCDQWRNSYNRFLEDVGLAPDKHYSLGRLNTSLGYFKNNCKWMTNEELSKVRASVLKITYNNLTLTTKEWGALLNISPNLISNRLLQGWSVEEALEYKIKTKHSLITYKQRTLSIKEWSDEIGISINALRSRLKRNWPIEQALGYEERS